MAHCRIELFGGPIVRLGVESLTKFETRKTALLLGVLALEPGRTWNRNAICDILWQLEDPEIGRTRLRQAVSALRRTLGDANELLWADRIDLRLDGQVDSDTGEFTQLRKKAAAESDPSVRAGLLARAAALVREDFLPGFTEDWAVIQRETFRAERLEAIENAARIYVDLGLRAEAVDSYAYILRQDPLREDVARKVMALYAEAGMAPNAIRVYKELASALQIQIGFDPSQETKDLLESIRKAAPRASRALVEAGPVAEAEISPKFPPLPEPATPLFGREEEIESVVRLLRRDSEARLVTLTGIGGIGKTRLSLEIARRLSEEYEAVWQVALETLDDAENLPVVILEGSGLRRASAGTPLNQLADQLAPIEGVLVLDNFEQIVEGGAQIVDGLVKRCPNLRILVTSRVQLCIAPEREVLLAPLPLPGGDDDARCASVELFLERCRAIRPGFDYSPAVSQLVERLEGIPLALTLAAARAQVLSAEQMLEQIERRFEFLAARRRDLPERHRTMAAAIDWSVQTLDEKSRQFFAALSVFRGGFTLEGAAAVADCDDALDAVQALRERSLVLADEAEGGIRFRMLETIREFATGLLAESERSGAERRHSLFFAHFATEANVAMRTSDQGQWLRRMDAERPNILAALEWSGENAPELGAEIIAGYWMYWHVRGRYHEGRDWGRRILDVYKPKKPTELYARAVNGLGVMYDRCCDYETARMTLRESIEVAEKLEDRERLADALNNLGNLEFSQGCYDVAREVQTRGLKINEENGRVRSVAMISANLGNIACAMKDYGAAEEFLNRALQTNREQGIRHWEGNNLTSLGIVALARNDLQRAGELLAESLDVKREVGHPMGIALTLILLSHLERRRGNLEASGIALSEGVKLLSSFESPDLFHAATIAASRLAVIEGRLEDGALLLGFASALREKYHIVVHLFERDEYELRESELRTALGESFEPAAEAGAKRTPSQVVPLLLSICEINHEPAPA